MDFPAPNEPFVRIEEIHDDSLGPPVGLIKLVKAIEIEQAWNPAPLENSTTERERLRVLFADECARLRASKRQLPDSDEDDDDDFDRRDTAKQVNDDDIVGRMQLERDTLLVLESRFWQRRVALVRR